MQLKCPYCQFPIEPEDTYCCNDACGRLLPTGSGEQEATKASVADGDENDPDGTLFVTITPPPVIAPSPSKAVALLSAPIGTIDNGDLIAGRSVVPQQVLPGMCPNCRSPADRIDSQGICLVCYAQAVPPLRDDFYLQVNANVAARSNLGKRHRRNEDFAVVGSIEVDGKTTSWFVVCDGVSRSKNPQAASEMGATVSGNVLKQTALSNEAPSEDVLRRAILAAQDAVSALEPEPNAYPDYGPPASTIVAALVKDGFAYLGWCGDSRIYAVDSIDGSLKVRLLSRDHSVLNEYLDEGMSLEQAMAACPANELHAMVQCLVRLAEGEEFKPSFATVNLEHTLCLIGCTDGVWNDAHPMGSSDASKFAEWFASCQGDALSFATQAVNFASGVDNDTCAVILF